MNDNVKVITFVVAMCLIVATLLAGLRSLTLERALVNEAVFNQRAILKALQPALDRKVDELSNDEVVDIFAKDFAESKVINYSGEELDGEATKVNLEEERKKDKEDRKLPFFVYNNSGKTYYVLSIRGNGLWDEIWGNIALEEDLKTIVGASFDHRGETPGLGAEIKDNPSFFNQFQGKSVFKDNQYIGVTVRKGGAKDKNYEVDGISGATITADGVTEMIVRGFNDYAPYLTSRLKK